MKQIRLKTNHLTANSKSYITDYLGTLGVKPEDVPSFIDKPRIEDEESAEKLCNIKRAAEVLMLHLQDIRNQSNVFVQVDSDTDGYTSASIIIDYLRRRFDCNVKWRLHNGKEHGIIVESIPRECDLVIIPDAGSNQFEEHTKLNKLGKDTIILDHHEVTDENLEKLKTTPAIIVNNQLSEEFKNKNLSGAGVVYKFIKYIDEHYFASNMIYEDYADLAAIGIIADAMNMLQLDNNFIAYKGLNNIKSNFIKEIAARQSRGIKDPEHLTKIDVAFYIAPVINGVVRSGSVEDKEAVFRAMSENNCTEMFVSTWRGNERNETLYQYAARLASNAKARQDSSKKKSFEWLCEKIESEGWNNDNIIIATMNEKESAKVSSTITGLIAMELVKHYNKPTLVLRQTEENGKVVYGGSGRNGNFYGLSDLKSALHDAGAYFVEGHANAFGSILTPEQIPSIRQYFNENLDAATFNDTVYDVDYWFSTNEELDYNMLYELAKYEFLYGNSIPQPRIAIDTNFTNDDVYFMGATKNSIKIMVGRIGCVSFSNDDLTAQLQKMPNGGHATIVGRPQINEWNGTISVQMMIDDIKLTPPFTTPKFNGNIIDLI